MKKRHIKNLLIVSHVIHYQWKGVLYAYGPYVREIDIWADLFPHVTIAAPLTYTSEKPSMECLPFSRSNVFIAPQLERGGASRLEKLIQIASLPSLVFGISVAMWNADAIQVRCPGNLGLLGVILAPFFSKYCVAKYAGQWDGYEGEAWSYRLQRRILGSKWWKGPVIVYGHWPSQPGHIIPFFTSIMESKHLTRAQEIAVHKSIHNPLRILFVGRLTREKNIHVLLNSLCLLQGLGIEFKCRIIGNGPLRSQIEEKVTSMGLNAKEILIGALPFEQVLENYEWADVLVLASETEGWPKAVTEAMAFGLVCVGSNRGLVPQILADGRGVLVEPGDEVMLASALQKIAIGEVEFKSMSHEAFNWAQRYSLDGLRGAIRGILMREWHLTDDMLRALP